MKPYQAASIAGVVALLVGFAAGWLTRPAQPHRDDGLQAQIAKLQSQLEKVQTQLEQSANSATATAKDSAAVRDPGGKALAVDELSQSLQQALTTESRLLHNEIAALQRLIAEVEQNRYSQFVRAGVHLHEAGYDDEAIVEFTKAIGCDPLQANAYLDRGLAFQNVGRWEKAHADFLKATELAPDNFMAWNNLAWLLATCPVAEIRDGAAAVAGAEKACELTEWKYFAPLSSLATAHAEAGDFKQAIEWQRKAIAAAPDPVHAALEENLDLFQRNQPVRQRESESGADPMRP